MNLPIRVDAPNALAMREDELVNVLQTSLYPGAALDSIKLVIGYCKAAGLDPMQKPVHIVPMWDGKLRQMRDVIMPGINLYRTQASRSGECAGVSEPEFGPDVTEKIGGVEITYPQWCRVTVMRRLPSGDIVHFTAKELWRENYAVKGGQEKSIAPNAMWTRRPYGQLAKCTEAQAFRKAFPEMGGAYTAEEMEGKQINEERDITPVVSATPALREYPADRFNKNFPAWRDAIAAGKKSASEIIATVSSGYSLSEEQKAQIIEAEMDATTNEETAE